MSAVRVEIGILETPLGPPDVQDPSGPVASRSSLSAQPRKPNRRPHLDSHRKDRGGRDRLIEDRVQLVSSKAAPKVHEKRDASPRFF